MSVQAPKYTFLDHSSNRVFFDKPATVEINDESKTRYAASQKIETLIAELGENGPLIALATMGPTAYVEDPFKLKDQIFGKDIYGWKAGATRTGNGKHDSFIVLGAQKNADKEYVYFTLSQDITKDSHSFIRVHRPSNLDNKIYIVSHKTFRQFLFDIYPSKASAKTPEYEFVEKLALLPLDSILDRGAGEAKCKAIGQEAFEKFKADAKGNSYAAGEAVVKICDTVKTAASDGRLRKQYIERAWDGIGDTTWSWRG